MKIAAGILSLFLGLIVLMQSCVIASTAGLSKNVDFQQAGSVGLLVGLLFFVAGAFAFALPQVSAVLLVLAGLFALMVMKHFPDMGIWAFVAFGLAAMAAWARRSMRQAAMGGVSPAIASPASPTPVERREPTVGNPSNDDEGRA